MKIGYMQAINVSNVQICKFYSILSYKTFLHALVYTMYLVNFYGCEVV